MVPKGRAHSLKGIDGPLIVLKKGVKFVKERKAMGPGQLGLVFHGIDDAAQQVRRPNGITQI